MLKQYQDPKIGAGFFLAVGDGTRKALEQGSNHLRFLWNRGGSPLLIGVDDRELVLLPSQIMCCTYLQKINLPAGNLAQLMLLSFNRPFYCIHTNDAEVSCNGLLFFGSDYTPVISLDGAEQHRLETLTGVLQEEFDIVDRNQEEMLRLLLKRLIIRITRLARQQLVQQPFPDKELDIVRKFNVLLEEHFRTHKQVSAYADMMHRSPKTLTNVFAAHALKSPLQLIHDRVLLEAKRMLRYTGKPVKEIAFELGFEEPSQFSRFFKKQAGLTPQEYKDQAIA